MISKIKNSLLYTYYISNLWKSTFKANKQKTAILMYHGITDEPVNVWTQISSDDFEKQMQFIKEHCNPISLDTYVDARIKGTQLPDHSVCVTFDDGFKNNYTTAYPILKKHNIPSTIFITTSFIDKTGKYEGYLWTDYILMLLIASDKKTFSDEKLQIPLTEMSNLSDKIKLKNRIAELLKSKPQNEKDSYIESLRKNMAVSEVSKDHPVFSGMSIQELTEIAKDPLITIGAHTVNHPILSRIPNDEIEKEIIGSKVILEQNLNTTIRFFAYPNGQKQDYNNYAIDVVKQHFDAACSTTEGLSDTNDDLFQLKRISLGSDTRLWQFKLYIAGVYESIQKLKR